MDLLSQPLIPRCESRCAVDDSQCVKPEGHADWHENDNLPGHGYRSWRINTTDVYFEDAKEDPLNVFLDVLEELGIPDGIDLKVKHLDVWYTWRGDYWAVHQVHEHAL